MQLLAALQIKVIEILDRDEFIKKNKNTKKLIWNAFDWVKTNDAFQ